MKPSVPIVSKAPKVVSPAMSESMFVIHGTEHAAHGVCIHIHDSVIAHGLEHAEGAVITHRHEVRAAHVADHVEEICSPPMESWMWSAPMESNMPAMVSPPRFDASSPMVSNISITLPLSMAAKSPWSI